jgi:hypothetical protein
VAKGKLGKLFFGGDDEDDFRSLLGRLKTEDSSSGQGAAPENALAALLAALGDVFERGSSPTAWKEIVEGMQRTFGCTGATIYRQQRDPGLRNLASWKLRPIAGRRQEDITQRDAKALPQLKSGQRLKYDRSAAEAAVRQAIATAFEERRFVGVDIEKSGIVAVTSESEDLGDGRISCYAIPLIYRQRRGRFAEKKVVGVVCLEDVPVVYGMSGLVGTLEGLLAHAMMLPITQQRDAVTGMLTELPLKTEAAKWFDFSKSIRRRSRSGAGIPVSFIFGMPDLLTSAYRMEARADSLLLSDVKYGLGTVLTNLLNRYNIRYNDGSQDTLTWGFAGNVSEHFFCVGLPGVTKNGALEFARKAKEEVIRYPFKFEERLPLGEVTCSQLVVEINQDNISSPSKLFDLALPELNRLDREQRAAVGGEMKGIVNVVSSYEEGAWNLLASGDGRGLH